MYNCTISLRSIFLIARRLHNYDSANSLSTAFGNDCQEPGSSPEPYARQLSLGYLYLYSEMSGRYPVSNK